ncbi:MAG: NUDIX hydrolase [Burkholderiaceae bacterium]|nr:NUDIX hydrolase [Burkholderiaceae bacterium]
MSDPDAHLREECLEAEQVYRGNFLDVRRDHVRLPNGAIATREYIVHPGAVMIVPLLDDGRLVVERQYRYPVAQVMLEFPAGKLEAGEAPLTCAIRELAEETGYRATEWARAGITHNAIAYSTEGIEIWFARGLTAGTVTLDEGEFLDVDTATLDELEQAAQLGTLTDVKTLVGLLWLRHWRDGRWGLTWMRPDVASLDAVALP